MTDSNISSNNKKEKDQKVTVSVNPNPTMQALTETQDLNADLTLARTQLADQLALTKEYSSKINSLDQEIAHLKDDRAKLQNQQDVIFKSFQDLYKMYEELYNQVISSNTALTITSGKLAEALVRCKFTIPQQEQPQQ